MLLPLTISKTKNEKLCKPFFIDIFEFLSLLIFLVNSVQCLPASFTTYLLFFFENNYNNSQIRVKLKYTYKTS